MVAGEPLQEVHLLDVLGTVGDPQLTFQALLDRTCAKLLSSTKELGATIHDLGLGVPLAISQFTKRVCLAVPHGTEPLASFVGGWSMVAAYMGDLTMPRTPPSKRCWDCGQAFLAELVVT